MRGQWYKFESKGPRTKSSKNRSMDVSGQAESKFAIPPPFFFCLDLQWIGWCPPALVRTILTHSSDLNANLFGNSLTDTSRKCFTSCLGVLWPQQHWHIKLTIPSALVSSVFFFLESHCWLFSLFTLACSLPRRKLLVCLGFQIFGLLFEIYKAYPSRFWTFVKYLQSFLYWRDLYLLLWAIVLYIIFPAYEAISLA